MAVKKDGQRRAGAAVLGEPVHVVEAEEPAHPLAPPAKEHAFAPAFEEELRLEDLIDLEEWVATQNRIARASKLGVQTVDRQGVDIVAPSMYNNYANLVQSTPEGQRLCRQSLLEAASRAEETHAAVLYDCRCGLIKAIVPCYAGRYRLCSVAGGQVTEQELKPSDVRKLARDVNVDERSLVEYAAEVQIRDRQDVQAVGELLFDVCNRLIAQALANRQQQQVVEEMSRIQRLMQQLSTPILEVWPGILTLPLVGQIDSQRARQIMQGVLDGITQYKAQIVILDITGVPIVDSKVADHLVKTVQAVSLKGARCIFTGISSTVAQTLVTLGIELATLQTAADLRAGIEKAFNILGLAVVSEKVSDADSERRLA